jgi:molybdate transport system substrate-binding protein
VPGSTTGIYLTTKVFPRLDVAKTMTVKITQRASEAAALVAAGDADLVIQPVSELLHAPGVDFVDTIPTDLQYISVFTAAVVAGSRETDAAKQLIAFLSSENANIAIKRSGMAPARRQ